MPRKASRAAGKPAKGLKGLRKSYKAALKKEAAAKKQYEKLKALAQKRKEKLEKKARKMAGLPVSTAKKKPARKKAAGGRKRSCVAKGKATKVPKGKKLGQVFKARDGHYRKVVRRKTKTGHTRIAIRWSGRAGCLPPRVRAAKRRRRRS